jgi:hypothetical protein
MSSGATSGERYDSSQHVISSASGKEESPPIARRAFIIPAASYSPTELPLQYHRL